MDCWARDRLGHLAGRHLVPWRGFLRQEGWGGGRSVFIAGQLHPRGAVLGAHLRRPAAATLPCVLCSRWLAVGGRTARRLAVEVGRAGAQQLGWVDGRGWLPCQARGTAHASGGQPPGPGVGVVTWVPQLVFSCSTMLALTGWRLHTPSPCLPLILITQPTQLWGSWRWRPPPLTQPTAAAEECFMNTDPTSAAAACGPCSYRGAFARACGTVPHLHCCNSNSTAPVRILQAGLLQGTAVGAVASSSHHPLPGRLWGRQVGGGAGVWRGARQRNGCFDRLLLQRQAFASKTAAFAAKSEVTYNVLLPLGGHASPRDGHGGEKRPPVPPGPAACALAGMPPRIRGQAVRARAGVSGASAWHSHACSSIDSARRRRQRRWHYCGRVGAAHADSTALIIFSSWWDGGRVGGVDPAAACCCCRLQRSRHVGVVWPALPLR